MKCKNQEKLIHENKDEILAQIVLQKIFPDEFSDIKLRFPDRPDLENKKIGIEVTNCNTCKREKRTEKKFYEASIKKEMGLNIENEIKEIEKENQTIKELDGGLIKTMNSFEVMPQNYLLYPFLMKQSALNNGYDIYDKNILFLIIGSNISFTGDEDLIKEFIEQAVESQTDCSYKFDAVYIYDNNILYVCDLIDIQISPITISSSIQQELIKIFEPSRKIDREIIALKNKNIK